MRKDILKEALEALREDVQRADFVELYENGRAPTEEERERLSNVLASAEFMEHLYGYARSSAWPEGAAKANYRKYSRECMALRKIAKRIA